MMSGWTEQDLLNVERARANPVFRPPSMPILKRSRARNVAPKEERFYNGRTYHSKAEMNFAIDLDLQKRCAAIADWKPQVAYPIIWPGGKLICKLKVDFEVLNNDGTLTCFEVKGHVTDVYAIKFKLFKAAYPRVDYRVVKAK